MPPRGDEQPSGTRTDDSTRTRTVHSNETAASSENIPVRIVNVSDEDRILAGGTTLGRCEPVKWMAPINDLEPEPQRTRGLCEQLQRVVSSARPMTSTREDRRLEEFIRVPGCLRENNDDYGRTDRN
jgi:hypothetical protein